MSIEDLRAKTGCVLGISPWLTITQERIDAFADTTLDRAAIHIDPAAARASPLGTTIAHGALTLSLLAGLYQLACPWPGVRLSLNYGYDKVRFLAPVPVNARIRGVFTQTTLAEKRPGAWLQTLATTVEIEGAARPALAADWLVLHEA